ncbi:Hsp20 family protein [candidate division GN15 bacterium]|nr:Hsp20 family protein [candidate division GN15 bacterium]
MYNLIHSNRVGRDLDRVFDDFFRLPAASTEFGAPRVNITESDDVIKMTFEVPGVDKEDIKVSVKNDMLTVSGERKAEVHDENESVVRTEITTGSFNRSFTLPDTVDPEKIEADYHNGMLVVKMTKREEVKPRDIEIKVS